MRKAQHIELQRRPIENIEPTTRRSLSAPPLQVAAILLLAWLGMWIHEFTRIPAQFGFTLEGLLFYLLPAAIIWLAWWRFPWHFAPMYGMWALGILHGVGGGVLSVLPLPIWPFLPDQTASHYIVHGIYFLAQIPLLLLALSLQHRLRARNPMC